MTNEHRVIESRAGGSRIRGGSAELACVIPSRSTSYFLAAALLARAIRAASARLICASPLVVIDGTIIPPPVTDTMRSSMGAPGPVALACAPATSLTSTEDTLLV